MQRALSWTILIASLSTCMPGFAGDHAHKQHGTGPLKADHEQLRADKAKLQADRQAGNKAAMAADRAAVEADKAKIRQDKQARKASGAASAP